MKSGNAAQISAARPENPHAKEAENVRASVVEPNPTMSANLGHDRPQNDNMLPLLGMLGLGSLIAGFVVRR